MAKLTEEEKAQRKAAAEKKAAALKEAQIEEAIKIMKILKMNESIIENFKKGKLQKLTMKSYTDPKTQEKMYLQIIETVDEDLKKQIEELENKYKFTCYYVMENKVYDEIHEALLIICKQKSEWKQDEEAAADESEEYKEMFSYVLNLNTAEFSEFGYIGIKKINNEYTRIY